MKKYFLITLAAVFVLSLSAAPCFSQSDRTVANTSKKGSLLIWPLVKAGPGETTLILGNDYYEAVKVRCIYRAPFPFTHTDWTFSLAANQTIAWLASTGKGPDGKAIPAGGTPPKLAAGTTAELRCFAVNDAVTQQIAWNWLSGEAIVSEGKNQNWAYSPWRFAVNSSTTGATAGTAGTIALSGDTGNYDACPTGLIFNFLKQTPSKSAQSFPKGRVHNVLTLVPCSGNYSTNSGPIVYTGLATYDEAQNATADASICVGSGAAATQWFSESLISPKLVLDTAVANPFTSLATPGGSISIHGRAHSNCTGSTGVPLIGVMSMQFTSGKGPVAGVPPTAAGFGQAYVRDSSDANTATRILMQW